MGGGLELKYWPSTAAGTGSAAEAMLLLVLRPEEEDDQEMDEAGETGGEYADVRVRDSDKLRDAATLL